MVVFFGKPVDLALDDGRWAFHPVEWWWMSSEIWLKDVEENEEQQEAAVINGVIDSFVICGRRFLAVLWYKEYS